MKRKLLLLTLLTTLSFSDDAISLPLEEAVQVNTKLIQVLFEENKLLRNELNQIKEKLNVSEKDKEYVVMLTELICRDSRQNFTRNYKRLNSSYDRLLPKVSKAVSEREGFGFDIIDF